MRLEVWGLGMRFRDWRLGLEGLGFGILGLGYVVSK